jgi:hypothetical protein
MRRLKPRWGFRYREAQLPLVRDVQHPVVVLDHGHNLALEAAVFTLLMTRWPTMNFIRICSLIRLSPGRAWPPGETIRLRLPLPHLRRG